MDTPILVAIIGVLAAPIAAFVTWFANRKKHIADIYSALAESSQSAVETMQMTMTTLHDELKEAKSRIEDLITENGLLKEGLLDLKKQNDELIRENRELRTKIEEVSQQMMKFHEQRNDADL